MVVGKASPGVGVGWIISSIGVGLGLPVGVGARVVGPGTQDVAKIKRTAKRMMDFMMFCQDEIILCTVYLINVRC